MVVLFQKIQRLIYMFWNEGKFGQRVSEAVIGRKELLISLDAQNIIDSPS